MSHTDTISVPPRTAYHVDHIRTIVDHIRTMNVCNDNETLSMKLYNIIKDIERTVLLFYLFTCSVSLSINRLLDSIIYPWVGG